MKKLKSLPLIMVSNYSHTSCVLIIKNGKKEIAQEESFC